MAPIHLLAIPGLLALASASPAALEARRSPKCTDFKIPVAASAKTLELTKIPKSFAKPDVLTDFIISSASALAGGEPVKTTNGTYMMAGRYCEPMVYDAAKADTIFYMQHAITMRKEYWTGEAYPHGFDGNKYSFIDVASKAGYPTVAFDNLGTGGSDHPDPVLVTQQTLQVEIIHQIIQKFRHGEVKGPFKGKKYKKVIYAGHSYGSICGNGIATHHPKDVDAFILTGYSPEFFKGGFPLAAGILVPAREVHPRFKHLNPGYLAMSSEKGRSFALYTSPNKLGGYAPKVPHFDYTHEGTGAIGEVATLLYGVGPADNYKGHILVITGENDAIVCNNVVTNVPHCGHGKTSIPMRGKKFFPNAKTYDVHIPALTGHSANMHYTSPESFKVAMNYLKKIGM